MQERIREALDAAPAGRIRVVSMCAGQGRDLIGALEGLPRRGDVTARHVELDARNVASARTRAEEAGLAGISVVEGDASATDAYAGAVPAEVVLVCGPIVTVTPRREHGAMNYALDCSDCVGHETPACDDCVVKVIVDRQPVLVDDDDVRALGVLAEAGLVPAVRRLRAVS